MSIRFSSRTLLLIVALIALAAWAAIAWLWPIYQRAEASNKWRSAGALVLFDKNGEVYALIADMSPGAFKPSSLPDVQSMPSLYIVMLNGTSVSDADLLPLLHLPKLLSLDLAQTHITDQALTKVAKIKTLRTLILKDTIVSDACIPDLIQLPNLHDLDVSRTQISAGGLAQLQAALPHTTIYREPADNPSDQSP